MRKTATWYNTQGDDLRGTRMGQLEFEATVSSWKPRPRPNRARNEAAAAKRREQFRKEREAWKR
jgi:hypothetical protein